MYAVEHHASATRAYWHAPVCSDLQMTKGWISHTLLDCNCGVTCTRSPCVLRLGACFGFRRMSAYISILHLHDQISGDSARALYYHHVHYILSAYALYSINTCIIYYQRSLLIKTSRYYWFLMVIGTATETATVTVTVTVAPIVTVIVTVTVCCVLRVTVTVAAIVTVTVTATICCVFRQKLDSDGHKGRCSLGEMCLAAYNREA